MTHAILMSRPYLDTVPYVSNVSEKQGAARTLGIGVGATS